MNGMEGPFGYSYEQDQPDAALHIEPWKYTVQEMMNEMIVSSLSTSAQERTPSYLLGQYKGFWQQMVSPQWFHYHASYYLWLAHTSGTLLPLLEKEQGRLDGWLLYSKTGSSRRGKSFSIPIIQCAHERTLYVFENDYTELGRIARAAEAMMTASGEKRGVVNVHSVENGKSLRYKRYA